MKLCGFEAGNDLPVFLISGTCVVESEQMSIDTAGTGWCASTSSWSRPLSTSSVAR